MSSHLWRCLLLYAAAALWSYAQKHGLEAVSASRHFTALQLQLQVID